MFEGTGLTNQFLEKKNKNTNYENVFHLLFYNRPLILEVLKIFPKLSRLDVEVTEMKKYDEKKKKFEPLDEQKKINAQLSQKDKIYFNLNLKEIWLNVDMVLEERNLKNRIINKNSLHFEILNENNSDNINDNIADYGIYLWGCRDNIRCILKLKIILIKKIF